MCLVLHKLTKLKEYTFEHLSYDSNTTPAQLLDDPAYAEYNSILQDQGRILLCGKEFRPHVLRLSFECFWDNIDFYIDNVYDYSTG